MALPNKSEDLKGNGYTFLNDGVCSYCGSDIEWYETPYGTNIPLDPMPEGRSPVRHHRSTCTGQ
jgi:hypothetical protein